MRLFDRVSDAKWWLLHRFHPGHRYNVIRTGLKPGYYDVDELMLHGCMELLRRYVENERGGLASLKKIAADNREEGEDFLAGAEKEEEAAAIYEWWTARRPEDEAALHDHIMARFDAAKYGPDRMPGKRCGEFEQELSDREDEMLARLVKIRRSLWT